MRGRQTRIWATHARVQRGITSVRPPAMLRTTVAICRSLEEAPPRLQLQQPHRHLAGAPGQDLHQQQEQQQQHTDPASGRGGNNDE